MNITKSLLSIPALVLATASLPLQSEARIKSIINIAANNDHKECHLVIYKPGEDPKNSPYQIKLSGGKPATVEVEADWVEKYNIVDYGEILEKNSTTRFADLILEDGATIDITVDVNNISVKSTGYEFTAREAMKNEAMETFKSQTDEVEKMADGAKKKQALKRLNEEYVNWELDYYANNPTFSLVLDVSDRLNSFNVLDTTLKPMLDIYHNKGYDKINPDHPVHTKISEAERTGYQLTGGKYHDFNALTLDGDTVKITDYLKKGRMTLVVLWATWCRPCRKEALDLIPLYKEYKDKGIDFIGIAREFKTADDIKLVLEQDKHPWPTLIDLDDRFRIFDLHGLTSSGFYLIDEEGKILKGSYYIEDIKEILKSRTN